MALGLFAALAGPGNARAEDAPPESTTVGDVTGFRAEGPVYRLSAGPAEARVSFVSEETFRIELAPDGRFTDPTGEDIVLPQGKAPRTRWKDRGDRYELSTDEVTLRAYKKPLRFALHRADGSRVWSEAKGLSWTGDTTVQTLARGAGEQFYGAGMQNGRGNTSHRDKTVQVAVDYNWNDRTLLPLVGRLRRLPQHLRPGHLRVHRPGDDQREGTALRRLLLRR